MIKAIIRLIVILLIGNTGAAETLGIRSGEHADFTRLVIENPTGSEWNIGRVENGYSVQIAGASAFDLTGVFDRIPRGRIAGLRSHQNILNIQIACVCYLDAFTWQQDHLVVDVKDGVPPQDAAFEAFFNAVQTSSVLPLVLSNPSPQKPNSDKLPIDLVRGPDKSESFEALVAEGLSRAASQGLLELADPNGNKQPFSDNYVARNGPGVLAHTSFEHLKSRDESIRRSDAISCIDDTHFDILNWADETPFTDQIAYLRQGLYGEFDQVNADKVTALAKVNLHFGFGIEAKAILDFDGQMTAQRSILGEIANIIENTQGDDTFARQLDCAGASSLWAFLSLDDIGPAFHQSDKLLGHFRNLPVYLQDLLGPRLAQRFAQIGAVDAAELVLGPTKQALSNNVAVTHAKAAILSQQGDDAAALTNLENLALGDTRMTPDALITYLEIWNPETVPLSSALIDLADILIFEESDLQTASKLAEAQIMALLKDENAQLAFEKILQHISILATETIEILQSQSVKIASKTYDDIAFLEMAFSTLSEMTMDDAQNIIASRLIDLGFPARAQELVSLPAAGDDLLERRYIRAEVALMLGQPDSVSLHLDSIFTQRADQLREQANLIKNGSALTSNISKPSAWQLGNWEGLLQGDDPLLQAVSEAQLQEFQPSNNGDQPLGQGRALIAQSETTRELMNSLLNRFEPLIE